MIRRFLIAAIVMICAGLLISCGSQKSGWEYQRAIPETLRAGVSDHPVRMGVLSRDKVVVYLPGGTFDGKKEVTVSTPARAPQLDGGSRFAPFGSPVEISSNQKRENKPVEVTMQVDKAHSSDLKSGRIRVIYFNGTTWDMIRPLTSDAAAGTLTFLSYHMSIFGMAKIDAEEQIAQYVRSKSLGKLAQDNLDEIIARNVKDNLEMILKDEMGLDDESVRFKIISSLLNDDEYREVAEKLMAGDAEGFNKDLQLFIGKKIAEEVSESTLKTILENVSSDEGAGYLEAFSQAAGFVTENDFKSAAEVISEQLIANSVVAQAFKSTGEYVRYRVDLWKDSEIEAAYQAFKNGADDGYWGFDVDKGDFTNLYNQMKGLSVKIEGDYIKVEEDRRRSLSIRPMTEAEMAKIRERAKKDLEDQFRSRTKYDSRIDKEAARMKQLVAKFEEAKLLEDGQFGYDADYDKLEDRLDQLFKLSQKILRDTKRGDWSTSPITNERTLSVSDMASLMQAWYSKDGKNLYSNMLRDKFGIVSALGIESDFTLVPVPFPKAADHYSQVLALLMKKAVFEVANNKVSLSYAGPFSVPKGGFHGKGKVAITGTYDPKTAILRGKMNYSFSGEGFFNGSDLRQTVTFAAAFNQKIVPGAKKVIMLFNGTSHEEKQAGWKGEWGTAAPYTATGVWEVPYVIHEGAH